MLRGVTNLYTGGGSGAAIVRVFDTLSLSLSLSSLLSRSSQE